VQGIVDLHCHFVAGIDDGARTPEEGIAMLRALGALGFELVVGTPHMHPSLFDNDRAALLAAFDRMKPLFEDPDLPRVALSSEHYFDDIVFRRLLDGEALPYPGGRAVLVEFHYDVFPARVADRFFDLRVRGQRPVLAHPERYRPVQRNPHVLQPLLDGGTALLLDVGALSGKYDRASRRAAESLIDEGWYAAACSDAHRPADVDRVAAGIDRLVTMVGADEARYLLSEGPNAILSGTLETD
jgi:protein-tyrosine phosphatase